VHVDLDTLATALYVRIDDELKASPQLNRWRPKVGITPKITDAELITVSVMQARRSWRGRRPFEGQPEGGRCFPSDPGHNLEDHGCRP
jgi:hypothetical protein